MNDNAQELEKLDEMIENIEQLRREKMILRMQWYWDRTSNEDGKWSKEQAVKFLLGSFSKMVLEPDYQIIDQ